MKKRLLYILCLFSICGNAFCQTFSGRVLEYGQDGGLTPIFGAMLQWKGTAVGGITDNDGHFAFDKTAITDTLIIIYQTYQNDTIKVPETQNEMEIILSAAHTLDAASVTAHGGAYISVKPILTSVITSEGLRKAACCNLSESFESSIAVDVEYSDAISGAKQISMLGLAGIYSQILLENVPYIRLLANQFGLGFIPGTWMESISISKGTASVTNGFEAISGQIDVEYKKPETNDEKLFINLFGSSMGKGELNLNSRFDASKSGNASGMVLLHTEGQFAKMDMNKDNFLDVPRNYQVNAMNRWDYDIPDKLEGRTMIGYLWEDRIGGEKNFSPKNRFAEDSLYGIRIKTNRLDVITKNGFLLKGEHESVGTILSFTFHDTRSYFGFKDYNAQQLSGYVNILYSNKFGKKEQHKLTVGGSVQADNLKDELNGLNTTLFSLTGTRFQAIPGIFAEYSFIIDEKLVVMPGLRFDYDTYNSQLYWTPRLHLKWQVAPNSSFRISAGKGYRSANVLIENLSLLASNRALVQTDKKLKPEQAYNASISFVQSFMMKGGKSMFTIDYYYTHFTEQVIVDLDMDAHSVFFYNLNGDYNGSDNRSYSHSAQAELTLYPIERLEIILAYRYNNVRQSTGGAMRDKALASPHKAVLGLGYATRFNKWKFNTTLQYNSSMRVPEMTGNASAELPAHSPDYFIWNAQITHKYKAWEFYIGGENLLNYKQKNPIIAADQPFGEDFDTSVIYAPITGIMGYAGIRFTMK
ncbi:MAG: TonB-dependent receptor [Bacteroidales bacterium]|nr:TonB-dependent receptor [Bacteroidales bacterium]